MGAPPICGSKKNLFSASMSEHRATIEWRREADRPFEYESYNRDHRWVFPNGTAVDASAAPDFLGDETRVDPEEAFVASLSSCHMLTFLAIAARKRLPVESYVDRAVGRLEKNAEGVLAVTEVILRPRIVFAADAVVSSEKLAKLHEIAHRQCFIANSVTTDVRVEADDSAAGASPGA